MKYLLGIDLGTSGTKTVLFDQNGKGICSATVEYPLYQPQNGWTATIDNLPAVVNGELVNYTWTEQNVLSYNMVSEVTEGNLTTFTNEYWTRPTTPPAGTTTKIPKTAGEATTTIEDYETPLGVEIVINHVGDCFD